MEEGKEKKTSPSIRQILRQLPQTTTVNAYTISPNLHQTAKPTSVTPGSNEIPNRHDFTA